MHCYVLFISSLLATANALLKIPGYDRTFVVLENYLNNVPTILEDIYSIMAVTETTRENTKDIAGHFIHEHPEIPVIIANKHYNTFSNETLLKIKTIFSFLNTKEDLNRTLQRANTYDFWHFLAYIQFIVCTPIEDYNWLEDSLKLIWKHYMINYVIVFVHNGIVETIGYNPFNNKILNFTKGPLTASRIFPDKLQNLQGYALKIVVFNDPPRTYHKNGKVFGQHIKLIKQFCKKVNATCKMVVLLGEGEKFGATQKEVLSGRADFSVISRFVVQNMFGRYSYPLEMDDVVIITPEGEEIPQSLSMFFTFSNEFWYGIILAYVLMTILLYLINYSSNYSLFSAFMDIFVISCNTQMYNLMSKKWSIKIFLGGWIIGCFIIGFAFQSNLTSTLVTPKYLKNLDTLEEVDKSELKICIPLGFAKRLPTNLYLKHKFVDTPKEAVINGIQRKLKNCSYALTWSYLKPIFQADMSVDMSFHIVKQRLVPGFGAYLYHPNSPYYKAVDKFVMFDREFSLSKYNNTYYSPVQTDEGETQETSKAVLKIGHLQGIFFVLFMGWGLSIIVFFFEIIGVDIRTFLVNKT